MEEAAAHDLTPERYVPGEMRGQLVEAEHLARYWWASRFAGDRRVLDAGCGTGYGTSMLDNAGARSVAGLDISEAALGAAREALDGNAVLERGDVAEMPFPDGTFDLVVCFEVIEHVEDTERVLDELRRVLAPDGLLLISSPNRREYPSGNPHHVHEYVPEEFQAVLGRRFAHVALLRQQAWVASIVFDDASFAASELEELEVQLGKVVGRRPGEETFTVALASEVELPDQTALGVVTSAMELRRWLGLYDEQQELMTRQAAVLGHHAILDEERGLLHRRLRETEGQLEALPRLERELHDALRDRDDARRRLGESAVALAREVARAERAERVYRELQASLSWRATAPLRRFLR